MEKRREKRVNKLLKVQINDVYPPVQGRSVDVSPSGIKIRLAARMRLLPKKMIHLNVSDRGRPYAMSGLVRWSSRNVLHNSQFAGIEFDSMNSRFCREILELEIGTRSLPYARVFETHDIFLREYSDNILQGGLMIPLKEELSLNRSIHVALETPSLAGRYVLEGEVIAKIPNGYGLRILDLERVKPGLALWLKNGQEAKTSR